MWDIYPIPKGTGEWHLNEDLNKKWISALPADSYAGVLRQSLWTSKIRNVLRNYAKGRLLGYCFEILDLLFPDISLTSICSMFCGPQKIIMHGRLFNPATVSLLYLMRKKIVHIHWGTPIWLGQGRKLQLAYRFAYSKCCQSYVLMKPEEAMFEYVTAGRVKTLPYASAAWEGMPYDEQNTVHNLSSRQILLGNNAYDFCSAGYKAIVEKLNLDEWDRITAMFNYGKGHSDSDSHITKRINELEEICGEKFFPWVTTVPYDEYLRIVNGSAFYFCPAIHHSGLGAIYTSIKQGKAIFLRGQNYEWIRSLGITASNLDEVNDFSYASLRSYIPDVETARRNYNIIKDICCSQIAQDSWVRSIESAFK